MHLRRDFSDARITGPASPGPDPNSTFVIVTHPRADYHVPIAGRSSGRKATGAIEVTLGKAKDCVLSFGLAVDDPSGAP